MRKTIIFLLIFALIIVGLFSGCVKSDNAEKLFEDLKNAYETGEKKLDVNNDFRLTINDVANEYSAMIVQFSDYVTLHNAELQAGKSFSDFEDYKDNIKNWYEMSYKIVNYNSNNVPEDLRDAWKQLQLMSAYSIGMLNKAYNRTGQDLMETLTELMNYLTVWATDFIIPALPLDPIAIGQSIKSDGEANVKIKSIKYTERVNPSDTSGAYSYYSCKNTSNIYLAVNYDFTNLQTVAHSDLRDFISMKAIYEGGYEYDGYAIAEASGRLTTVPNLIPLTEYDCWYLIEVPKTLQSTQYELQVTISGKTYSLIEK